MVLRIQSHMRFVATLIQLAIDGIMIVGCIQAQVLWGTNWWLWARILKSIESGKQQFAIMS